MTKIVIISTIFYSQGKHNFFNYVHNFQLFIFQFESSLISCIISKKPFIHNRHKRKYSTLWSWPQNATVCFFLPFFCLIGKLESRLELHSSQAKNHRMQYLHKFSLILHLVLSYLCFSQQNYGCYIIHTVFPQIVSCLEKFPHPSEENIQVFIT